MARSYKWSQSVVCGSSQPRRGQEASPGFPRFHQCFPASSGPRTPAQPSPACPGPRGLDQLSSQPRDGAMRSGTLTDCFQGNPCVFWPRNGQKTPGLKRTVPATSRAQEGPSGLPWLPRKLSKTPQDFGPLRGSEKCFYGHFMFCIFSIGTALDIYFVYMGKHVLIL